MSLNPGLTFSTSTDSVHLAQLQQQVDILLTALNVHFPALSRTARWIFAAIISRLRKARTLRRKSPFRGRRQDYDVIFETFAGNPANNHLHVEFDPD